jgi:zinc transport system substrate-binding protein
MLRAFVSMAAAVLLGAFACSPAEEPGASTPSAEQRAAGVGRLSVYTVNYPLAYFAQRIGGDAVEVVFPAPPEIDPAYWTPEPEVIAAYQKADLILLNGANYAKWLERATLPRSKMVDISLAFADSLIPLEEGVVHVHGLEGEHSHKGWAFTTWLDPMLALEQARAILGALTELRPASEKSLQANFEGLQADLLLLDAQLREITAEAVDPPLLFSHPVYQYLEARYGLNGKSLHWEADEMPSEKMWRDLAATLEEHPAAWMIWEGEPAPEAVRRLEGLGVRSVVYAPCGNRPVEGDFGSVMRENVEALRTALASGP